MYWHVHFQLDGTEWIFNTFVQLIRTLFWQYQVRPEDNIMNNEAKNPLQKMIDDTVALLNKRKLTDAILSAQTVSDLAEAEHDY